MGSSLTGFFFHPLGNTEGYPKKVAHPLRVKNFWGKGTQKPHLPLRFGGFPTQKERRGPDFPYFNSSRRKVFLTLKTNGGFWFEAISSRKIFLFLFQNPLEILRVFGSTQKWGSKVCSFWGVFPF